MVLKICKLGILLLAELKKTGGIFDEGAKPPSPLYPCSPFIPIAFIPFIPLKNFKLVNSVGLLALMNAGLPPRYDFIIVCGITV